MLSYYPTETQLLIRNWLRQKLFNHQFKNYHEMKTDCEIQLVLASLEQDTNVSS